VAVCTYNRAALLARCLDALLDQTAAPGAFEILVINNNSSDGTGALLERRRQQLRQLPVERRPRLRYLYETRQGLSLARNTALAASASAWIAFLDDDAIAGPDWAAHACRDLPQLPDDIGVVGGPIVPILSAPLPDWLPDWLEPFLTIIDLGDQPRQSDQESLFAGANVIFRREALQQLGGFSPRLGRSGTNLASNEEVYLWQLLRRRGWRCAYLPSLPVRHQVEEERLHYGWLMRRMLAQGRSDTTMQRLLGAAAGPPAWLYAAWLFLDGLRLPLAPAALQALRQRRLNRPLVASHAAFALKLGRLQALAGGAGKP
jgi:glycosyltransferase involved in cell wall biosynthesis